jgi:glycosyltransferase involved in cell wall biosynthesis
MPSRHEGFGLVYLEAMRLGRPCIVSDVDAGKEVAGEAGLAVKLDDQAGIARALVLLLSGEKEWEHKSRVALKRYESHFTEQHFRERLLSAIASWL